MKKCRRNNIRLLTRYLHGILSPKTKSEVESHLLDCDSCAETLDRLQEGDLLARMISEAPAAPDVWNRLEQSISALEQRPEMSKSYAVLAAAIAIFILSLGVVFWSLSGWKEKPALETRKYKEVALDGMANNTEPHIVTEGVVSEIVIDEEDGDYRIKLTESLKKPGPFVICEILPLSKIPVPEIGERVRVYGVSRYDNKPGHQWHEVHPVFSIETTE